MCDLELNGYIEKLCVSDGQHNSTVCALLVEMSCIDVAKYKVMYR